MKGEEEKTPFLPSFGWKEEGILVGSKIFSLEPTFSCFFLLSFLHLVGRRREFWWAPRFFT
jgi:hypothetical protein